MDKSSLINYIESSFIKDILLKEEITDISYNGKDIYYVSNIEGRKKSDIEITNQEAKDFLRQLSNITEKQFSYLSPILDINIGKYRLNGINSSVGRWGEESAVTFSLRIASSTPRIKHDEKFMVKELEDLFDTLILNHISIVIAGVTGVGKTELQKYLISRIPNEERIIIIDQTIELEDLQSRLYSDITLWQADERNSEASVSNLIKNGLRNNPDWMIVSEARGGEMNDILTSAMTGVPIIVTMHSLSSFMAPNRMAKMVMLNEKRIEYQDILSNIYEHFKIVVYLNKYIDKKGNVKRYISSILEIDNNGNKNEIYHDDLKKKKFAKISKNLSDLIINNKKVIKEWGINHE